MSVLYSFCVPGRPKSSKSPQCLEQANSFSVSSALLVGCSDTNPLSPLQVQPDDLEGSSPDLFPRPENIFELDSLSIQSGSPITPAECIESSSSSTSDGAVTIETEFLLGVFPHSLAVECSFSGKNIVDPFRFTNAVGSMISDSQSSLVAMKAGICSISL